MTKKTKNIRALIKNDGATYEARWQKTRGPAGEITGQLLQLYREEMDGKLVWWRSEYFYPDSNTKYGPSILTKKDLRVFAKDILTEKFYKD